MHSSGSILFITQSAESAVDVWYWTHSSSKGLQKQKMMRVELSKLRISCKFSFIFLKRQFLSVQSDTSIVEQHTPQDYITNPQESSGYRYRISVSQLYLSWCSFTYMYNIKMNVY